MSRALDAARFQWLESKSLSTLRRLLAMLARMGSPLGSPSIAATTAQLRNRLPTQWRRSIPLYAVCAVFLLVFLNLHIFHSDRRDTSVFVVRPPFSQSRDRQRPRADFPHKIWQTWKANPFDFESRDLDRARSWVGKNPDYRYEVLTDANEMHYVEYHYGPDGFNRPDIVGFYRDIRAAIVKADLLRYLVMYAEGGLYADIDVEALKPMSKFIPARYDTRDIDMVIGVEIDEPDWRDHPILGPKSRSFCQWVFMCKPQQPVMMRLVEQIMSWLHGLARKQGVSISDVELDFDEIISGTGPSAFTSAILADMNEHRPRGQPHVTWDHFHDMGESRIVSRILVLTVEAFAAGQGHSDSGNHEARAALVRHHYHASNWPSRHPRYSHPVYGEVENCNWNDDCVRKWDENVAAFKTLSAKEQKQLIADHEKEKKEKEEEERRLREEEEAQKRKKGEEEEAARKEDEDREADLEKEKKKKDKKG